MTSDLKARAERAADKVFKIDTGYPKIDLAVRETFIAGYFAAAKEAEALALAVETWRDAWADQDESGTKAALKAMLKAIKDYRGGANGK